MKERMIDCILILDRKTNEKKEKEEVRYRSRLDLYGLQFGVRV